MALSGPDALRALDDALRDIRREEDEVAKRAARHVELLVKLRSQEAELYRQLGAARLEPAERARQASQLAQINGAVESTIARYDAAFADAEAGLQHVEAAIARGSADRSLLHSETTRRDGELAALAADARPTLGSNADYAGKLATAREYSAIAEQAQLRAAQAEADREHNGRPFRDDDLFMYLWSRGYGTPSYRGKWLAAALDARVARLIGYDAARANFTLLTDAPVQIRAHAERMQEAARAAKAEIAKFENVALDSAGGRVAREAIEAAVARLEALDRENVVLQDRRDEAIRARGELAMGTDPAFAAALDDLAQRLEGDELWQVLAQARANPAGNDEGVMQQLDDLKQRLKDENDETADYRAQLIALASRRRDLEDILFELKARGFDNPHSQFSDNDLVGELLNAMVRGEMSAAAYWERWRKSQSWTAPGYGGPGGGWGRLTAPVAGSGLTRPRSVDVKAGMTSAA
jgi:chromosome segregation ATPase